MRACRKYVLVTVSSKVSASLRSSTTRGLTGCNSYSDRRCCLDLTRSLGCTLALGLMVAQHATHGEDAGAALLPGARRPAHRGHRVRTRGNGIGDLAVADHSAVAEDHGELHGRWVDGQCKVRLSLVCHGCSAMARWRGSPRADPR